MAAHPKVTAAQVAGAIERWHGNVAAAASELGIRREHLRERLDRLGKPAESYRPTGPRQGTIRVLPEHRERLRQAKFDLQAARRREVDETEVLAEFITDAFEAWLGAKLRQSEPPTTA